MQAEYVPPKEDVILENEASTDLYIIVSGEVVNIFLVNCRFEFVIPFIVWSNLLLKFGCRNCEHAWMGTKK